MSLISINLFDTISPKQGLSDLMSKNKKNEAQL